MFFTFRLSSTADGFEGFVDANEHFCGDFALVFRFVRVLVRMPLQRRPPIRFGDLSFRCVCIDAQRFVVRDVIVRLAVAPLHAPSALFVRSSLICSPALFLLFCPLFADHVLKIMTTTYGAVDHVLGIVRLRLRKYELKT